MEIVQTFISKGATVQEAIDLGLKTLNLKVEQVDIEIIQTEKKGFLGIRSREAIVKLTQLQTDQHEQTDSRAAYVDQGMLHHNKLLDDVEQLFKNDSSEESFRGDQVDNRNVETLDYNQTSLEGKVWVRDGQIHVRDGQKHHPSINIGNGIKLIKNGQIVEDGFIFVKESDRLEIETVTEQHPTEWKVTISDNMLEAQLEIRPGFIINRTVKDMSPCYQMTLETEEHYQLNQTLTYQKVLAKLDQLNITFGIKEEAINQALQSQEGGVFIIAKGTPATEGSDGYMEVKVETKVTDSLAENQNKQVIDYRERKKIPTVEKGQIIGMIRLPIPGRAGRTVTNEVIKAKPVQPVQVITQSGTILLADRIIANENGRPYIEKNGNIVKTKVLPQMVHEGNVDLESGHIQFQGDVQIIGQVTEGMMIKSGGNVNVHQDVSGATIHAAKLIQIHSSVNSSYITVGGEVDPELQYLLETVQTKAEQMYAMINQIVTSDLYKESQYHQSGIGALITLIKEKRFKTLTSEVRSFIKMVTEQKLGLVDQEWDDLANELNRLFLRLSHQNQSLTQFEQTINKMALLLEISKWQNNKDAAINVVNCLNSRLYSTGDIIVTGRSCINTYIQAEGVVKVHGIVRGGEIYGRNGIEIHEVGGKMGTKTVVIVPSDQQISIDKAHEGTIIKIGDQQYHVQEEKVGIRARLNHEHQLMLH